LNLGFGQEKLLSCQRNSIGFCNLPLANRIGVAASMLLPGKEASQQRILTAKKSDSKKKELKKAYTGSRR